MNIKVENKGACRKEIHIEAAADVVAEEYGKVVKAFEKVAKIRGFRQGKCPTEVVERHYSRQIEEELKERMLPLMYRKAIEKKQVKIASIVEISEVDFEMSKGMSFSVTVDVYPDFKTPKYKKISLKKNKIAVSESEVEDAVKRLLENFTKFEDVTGRPVKEGDLVMLDYVGESEGKPLKELTPKADGITEGTDFWMMVGEPELAPGFASALQGTVIGDKKDIEIHFPDDYQVTELSGKDVIYHIEIKAMREQVLPKIDEPLLKRLSVKSEAELRERIKDDILAEKERAEEQRLMREINDYLLKKASFDLPESIVAHETEITTKTMKDRLGMQGRKTAQIENEHDELALNARKAAEERVRLSYILARIAETEDIQASEADVNDRLKMMAMRYGMTAAQIKTELEKRGSLDGVKEDLVAEKTLKFILDNAKIKN